MDTTIVAAIVSAVGALIVGILSLAGVIITGVMNNKKIQNSVENTLKTAQAVTDTKLDNLTREVREHNNFAKRVPILEEKVERIEADIKELKEK